VVRKKTASVVQSQVTGPVQQIAQPGQNVSFSVAVSDATGVTYQWYDNNNTLISGATGDSLLLTNVTPNEFGQYSVVINPGNVTKTAELLLDSNGDGLPDQWESPYFGSSYQPSEADYDDDGVSNLDEFFDGTDPTNPASFRPRLVAYSDAGGSVTISPQLKLSYNPGESVTLTATPVLPNIFVGWAIELNTANNFNGENLQNTANPYTFSLPPPPPPPSTPPPSPTTIRARLLRRLPTGLVAWWRAEGNTDDIMVPPDNGTLVTITTGGAQVLYVPGKVAVGQSPTNITQLGQAFSFPGSNSCIKVSNSPNGITMPIDVGSGNGFTLEAWINPTGVSYPANRYPLFEWNDNDPTVPPNPNPPPNPPWGVQLWISEQHTQPNGRIVGGAGSLFTNIVDANNRGKQPPNILASATGLVVANQWQHVAVTYDKPSGISSLFLNGVQVASENLGSFNPLTTANMYLGCRPAGGPEPGNVFYSGLMDEPTIYNRALTQYEIYSIYSADFVGKDSIRPYFTTTSTFPVAHGHNYSQRLAVILGTHITYSLSTGPSWMSVSPSGMVSAIPNTQGTFDFTVRATDSTGLFTEAQYVLTVS
jgi:hypothetical protein